MTDKKNAAFDAVLFDFDGTYADTAPDMVAALNFLRSQHQLDPIPLPVARPYVSHGSRALVDLGFDRPEPTRRQQLIKRFLAAYENDLATHTRPFEGIENWVSSLESQAVPWGIVTNKPAYLTRKVFAQMPLAHAPHCIVAGDSLLKRKPHPMPVLHAAALLGVAASRCIYVGDARGDITAGRAAGMYTVAARYGYILPDDNPDLWNAHTIVDSVADLEKIVNALLHIDP